MCDNDGNHQLPSMWHFRSMLQNCPAKSAVGGEKWQPAPVMNHSDEWFIKTTVWAKGKVAGLTFKSRAGCPEENAPVSSLLLHVHGSKSAEVSTWALFSRCEWGPVPLCMKAGFRHVGAATEMVHLFPPVCVCGSKQVCTVHTATRSVNSLPQDLL